MIAFVSPVATRVHSSATIVRDDGRFEFADRLTSLPGHNSIYHKESGDVGTALLAKIREQLTVLAVAKVEAHPFQIDDIDPFEFETRDRRHLSYWSSGGRDGCSVWSPEIYEHFSVPRRSVEAYRARFDSVWRLILPLIEFPLFEPESAVPDEAWTFPLRSAEKHPRNGKD